MKILHPDNNEFKNLNELLNYKKEGVFDLIPKEEKEKLNTFLKNFEDFRERKKQKIKDPSLYNNLPYSINDSSWKSKQKDIQIVNKICGKRKELKILDFGGWNGWMSNYLTSKGHYLVVTDIFLDEFDGLKAIKYYNNSFIALQLLPNEIWRIQESFDVIIFNRNFAYLENKERLLNDAKKMLTKNGIIMLTGLAIYQFPEKIIYSLKKLEEEFINLYNSPFFLFKYKGYLDNNDLKYLKESGFNIYKYSFFKHLIKRIISRKSFNNYYAILQK